MIFDKSVLQSLSPIEAKWLHHHFRIVIPPVLFAEVLGDLSKERKTSTATGHGDAVSLARKVQSHSIYLNVDSDELVMHEITGRMRIRMDGIAAVEAERYRMPDGTVGALVDQGPLQNVLDRWCAGDFHEMERAFSTIWRNHLSTIDLEGMLRQMKGLRGKTPRTPEAVRQLVDEFMFAPNANHRNITFWLLVLGINKAGISKVVERWKRAGRPPALQFLPYAAYVARLKVYFRLGVGMGVIPTRSSNEIDFIYFEYLPFTRVLASGDKLHRDFFEQFALPFNLFVSCRELKAGLKEVADHWEGVSDDVRRQGTYTYADFPPVTQDNVVTGIYDHYAPNWRILATKSKPQRDAEADARVLEELRPMMDALKDPRNRIG